MVAFSWRSPQLSQLPGFDKRFQEILSKDMKKQAQGALRARSTAACLQRGQRITQQPHATRLLHNTAPLTSHIRANSPRCRRIVYWRFSSRAAWSAAPNRLLRRHTRTADVQASRIWQDPQPDLNSYLATTGLATRP